MKRPLAVIGFSMLLALTLLCEANNYNLASVTLMVSLALLFVSLLIKPLRQNMTIPTAILSVCVALCLFVTSNAQYEIISKRYSDNTVTVKGSLITLPTTNGSQKYYTIRTSEVNGVKEAVNIKITLPYPIDLEPTDTVTATLNTFMLGNEDDEFLEYYRSKNIVVGASYKSDDIKIAKGDNKDLLSLILNVRYKLYNEIKSVLPNDCGSVVCGLVLGEKSDLSKRVNNSFRLCGVSHLFAVSGLHVSIWSSLVYSRLRKLGVKCKRASINAIIFCLFFILLTGANPPVVRAGFMMILVYLANIAQKEAEPINSIGFSLIVMLFQNPYCALSISLWLSLLATLGILIMYNGVDKILQKPFRKVKSKQIKYLIEYINSLIAVCVSVNIFTLPVYFLKFKNISLVLLLANLLMVFFGKLCMEIAGIGSVISVIGLKFVGTPLIIISGEIAKFLIFVATRLSSIRHLLFPVDSPIIISVFVVSMTVLAFMKHILNKKGKILEITALCLALVFTLCSTYVYAEAFTTPKAIINQSEKGTSAVIKYHGYCAVIFADNEDYAASKVCDIIDNNAISRIDLLAVYTSPKRAKELISTYTIDEILTNDSELKNDVYFNGKISTLEHHTDSLSDLTVATQSGFCQIMFHEKTALICLDADYIPENYSCDLLICDEKYAKEINTDNFGQVIYTNPNEKAIEVKLS